MAEWNGERDTERRKEGDVEVTPLAAIPFCFISPFAHYFIIFKTTVTPPPSLRSSKPTFSSSSSSSSNYKPSVPLIISLFTLSLLCNIFLFASKQKYPSSPPRTRCTHPTPFCSVIQSWRQSAEGWVMMFCRKIYGTQPAPLNLSPLSILVCLFLYLYIFVWNELLGDGLSFISETFHQLSPAQNKQTDLLNAGYQNVLAAVSTPLCCCHCAA